MIIQNESNDSPNELERWTRLKGHDRAHHEIQCF